MTQMISDIKSKIKALLAMSIFESLTFPVDYTINLEGSKEELVENVKQVAKEYGIFLSNQIEHETKYLLEFTVLINGITVRLKLLITDGEINIFSSRDLG